MKRGIADVLESERLGHEEPGMRGVYVSSTMRRELKSALQASGKTRSASEHGCHCVRR